jgi:hypothetical protein
MKLSRIVAAAIFALAITLAHSAGNYQGTVTNVMPYKGSVYVLVANGGFDGAAQTSSCPFGTNMVYSIDPNTPFGRTLVAVAISAKVTGRSVYAIGNGVCVGSPYGGGASGEGLLGMDLKGN